MAVSTESLQVRQVVVVPVTVYVVHVQLANVYRLEVAVFAVILTVYRIGIAIAPVDCVAFIPAGVGR